MAATPATPDQDLDLVDTAEAAQRLGVQPGTIKAWRQRHPDFPPPYKRLAIGPVWIWDNIQAWAKDTGRHPDGKNTT